VENKKYLFICSSKYAILNSINAVLNNVKNNHENADLVIFHRTDDMKNLSERIKESKIFGNVYDFPFINKMNAFSLFKLLIFPKLFLSKLSLTDKSISLIENHYNILVSQSLLYASLFVRINKNAEVYLIEDGLSSYTGRTIDPQRRSVYFRLANKLVFKGSLLSDVKSQLLYEPDMYSGEIKNIIRLHIHKSENNILYNRLFEYRDNTLYNSHKFIYLGVPLYGLKDLMVNPIDTGYDFEEKCKFIIESAMKVPQKTKFIYRQHPIENIDEDYNKNNCRFDIYRNMWEIECQNTITNNHVLVSFFSTASFTPKMLYGKEPYVILLYKMLGVEFFNADELVSGLQSLYSNPKKVILVENLDELYSIIEKLEVLNDYDDFL
jgi:hypothetical protein